MRKPGRRIAAGPIVRSSRRAIGRWPSAIGRRASPAATSRARAITTDHVGIDFPLGGPDHMNGLGPCANVTNRDFHVEQSGLQKMIGSVLRAHGQRPRQSQPTALKTSAAREPCRGRVGTVEVGAAIPMRAHVEGFPIRRARSGRGAAGAQPFPGFRRVPIEETAARIRAMRHSYRRGPSLAAQPRPKGHR